jgi:hypothetical protein
MFRSHDILTIVALNCISRRIWYIRLRFAIPYVTNNELTFLLHYIPLQMTLSSVVSVSSWPTLAWQDVSTPKN